MNENINRQYTHRSKVRKRKKLLVLVNPVGGRGRAVEIWQQVPTGEKEIFESIQSTSLICSLSHHCEQVEDILVEVGISCEVVITTHAGHARYSIFLLHFFVIQFVRQKIRNPFFLQQIYVVHHKAKTCDTGSL